MQQLLTLLATFKERAGASGLCSIGEAFDLAAKELEIALKESEPHNLVAYIDPAVIALVHEALHFDASNKELWQRLAAAAEAIQSGPS